jgi:hypothetical protein
MLSGHLTKETLVEVLRNVSQRRRQGTLEIRYSQRAIRILFIQGKIAEVLEQGVNPAQEVLRRLRLAGICPEGFGAQVQDYSGLWSSIEADPVCQNRLTQKEFVEAIKHRVLDKLYELDFAHNGSFEFSSTHFDLDRNFVPSISVGQLLLDFVSLAEDQSRYVQLCSGEKQVQATGNEIPGLSLAERKLLDLCATPISPHRLRECSLLSAFTYQEAFLRLHEEGAIRIEAEPEVLSVDGFLDEQVLTHLDASIDAAFADETIFPKAEAIPSALEAPADSLRIVGQTEVAAVRMRASWRMKCNHLSIRLGANPWVPAIVMVLFLTASIGIPLMLWSSLTATF